MKPAQRLLHLRDQHQRAPLRRLDPVIEIAIGTQPAGHQLTVVEWQLSRNMQQAVGFHRRYIGRDRGRRLGQGQAEFGELGIDAIGH